MQVNRRLKRPGVFNKLVDQRASYTIAHVLKALLLLSEMPHGRFLLMKKLQLNEASARTLLSKLELNGYSKPSPYGHVLTSKGKAFVKKLRAKIIGPIDVGKSDLTMSENNIAYVIRNAGKKIRSGVEQRDVAITSGATGMTTLVYDKKLTAPSINRNIPKDLEKMFSLKQNDVVLIGSAKNQASADLATLYAAFRLVGFK